MKGSVVAMIYIHADICKPKERALNAMVIVVGHKRRMA